jgi:hypothetical protein
VRATTGWWRILSLEEARACRTNGCDEVGRVERYHPFLAKWFFGPDGEPDEAYKAAIDATGAPKPMRSMARRCCAR